ncbi:MAG: NAD(P)/FAD-dependent oxidoreductase [Myxococcales bacterium]
MRNEPGFTRREYLQASATLGAATMVQGCATGRATGGAAKGSAGHPTAYDVLIVGGGPAGLSAALALGRARKRVLLSDSGPRRNAAAARLHNFVTRDGTPPAEFRQIARDQLAHYPNVRVVDVRVDSVAGERGAFEVALATETVRARRILLCTGMVDELLPIEGFAELWGHAIFQCPYCHGWESQDRRWGYLTRAAHAGHLLPFAIQARSWSADVTVFTAGAFEVGADARRQLEGAGVRLETAAIARLVRRAQRLEAVELTDGTRVPCEVLFAHPPQRQVPLVRDLGLALDEEGYVAVDPLRRETSVPGIYASGDLTTRLQGAIFAASSGTHAAAMINVELSMELASTGAL